MIRLAVRCRPEQAEMVLAELTVLAPGGVEESAGENHVEYAIYGAEGELPDIGLVQAAGSAGLVGAAAGEGLVEVEATEVADDWAERWKAFHRPLEVKAAEGGSSIWLRPPWEPEHPDALEVVIDPGQAFGTGAHPTTRLSLELLLGLRHGEAGGREGRVTDLGTGSGILAIAADRLGYRPVAGFDHEEAAIEAAMANAEANGATARFERWDLRRGLPDLAPLVLANLTAPLLESVADQIDSSDRPDRLVCSGLLETERDRVVEAFGRAGLTPREFRALEGWGGLLLEAA